MIGLEMDQKALLKNSRFPRSSKYDSRWQTAGAYGGNSIWLAEWLCEATELRPGMRVLDLGCGRAQSSIFLAQEYGVHVWATDLWHAPEENLPLIETANLQDSITCVQADATQLPFEFGFFDAVLAFDSMQYFGTDCLFLPYITQFLKPSGILGFASAGLTNEIQHPVPAHLERFWTSDCWCLQTEAWWRNHWQRTGIVDLQSADMLSEGWRYWLAWGKANEFDDWYLKTIEKDAVQNLGYVRVIAKRSPDAPDLAYDLQTGKSSSRRE